jgi:conjugal transfer pilus assembly protein TraL
MSTIETDQYKICKYLDEQYRIIGLPLDEFIPLAIILVMSFLFKLLIVGILLMVVCWRLMRHFKKGMGSAALLVSIYWHMCGSQAAFRALPDSTKRYWV